MLNLGLIKPIEYDISKTESECNKEVDADKSLCEVDDSMNEDPVAALATLEQGEQSTTINEDNRSKMPFLNIPIL